VAEREKRREGRRIKWRRWTRGRRIFQAATGCCFFGGEVSLGTFFFSLFVSLFGFLARVKIVRTRGNRNLAFDWPRLNWGLRLRPGGYLI
jgi:hypothetical protein